MNINILRLRPCRRPANSDLWAAWAAAGLPGWILLAAVLASGCCWLSACPAAGWLLEKVRIQT